MKNYLAQNSKIKKMSGPKTYNFGIPAYKTSSGRLICVGADKCKQGKRCYAMNGPYNFPVVRDAYHRRYELTKSNRFVTILHNEICRRRIKRIRIHDSGDFYSKRYLLHWLLIISKNPNVTFYAYTKSISLFKNVALPNNFVVIFSYGGKQDHLINVDKDRHCRIFVNKQDLVAQGYADASNDDSIATGPNHKVGIVYHGPKSKKFTV